MDLTTKLRDPQVLDGVALDDVRSLRCFRTAVVSYQVTVRWKSDAFRSQCSRPQAAAAATRIPDCPPGS